MTTDTKSVNHPDISKIAFWDVDFDTIDFEASSLFVMNKVFNYGTWADIVAVFTYYGTARIKKEIVKSSYFKNTALSFLCTVLDLSETDFIAYQNRQNRVSVWNQ